MWCGVWYGVVALMVCVCAIGWIVSQHTLSFMYWKWYKGGGKHSPLEVHTFKILETTFATHSDSMRRREEHLPPHLSKSRMYVDEINTLHKGNYNMGNKRQQIDLKSLQMVVLVVGSSSCVVLINTLWQSPQSSTTSPDILTPSTTTVRGFKY